MSRLLSASLSACGWVVLLLLGLAAAAVWAYRYEPPGPAAAPPPPADDIEVAPPTARPDGHRLRHYPPGAVRLPADTAVLGLTLGGESRAYVLETFAQVGDHVAEDVIDGRPVSITYCDRRTCGKVFAGARGGDPLGLRPAGYSRADGMLLEAGGRVYRQEDGHPYHPDGDPGPPLAELPSVLTTWKDWAADHPGTAVVCYPTLWVGAWLRVYPARMADLPDAARVVGLSAGGEHRAYLLEAFDQPSRYVVHDFLNATPVAVTYCPESDRVRAFRSPDGQTPLSMTFAGWHADPLRGGMLLDVDGAVYDQQTRVGVGPGAAGPLPYQELPAAATTWGEWRSAHPDTGVYVGGRRDRLRLGAADAGGVADQLAELLPVALPVAAGAGLWG
ncbi:MAG: DUF3179 domain-containing protein, partial [Gemmataceae bacterium]|nr:DUF3179 domain-containing protein [Gemmataceae bacterium]